MKRARLKQLALAAIMTASLFSFGGSPAMAAQKLYDDVTTSVITKGVEYEFNHRLTEEGWQDIHVLKINMGDPYITLVPVESTTEFGKKETVLKMVNDAGAIAGVNGDFFGMSGGYSASFGPVIRDGNLISAGTDRNLSSNEYATFFIDKEGNPFIDYFKFNVEFFNNGQSHLEFASVNKITEMIYPIYFDRNAASSTKDLDARFPELVKIVVEDGMISYISEKGETVDVPENGYLIILSASYADAYKDIFAVGQTAEIKMTASVDLNAIETAISGAGKILSEGALPAEPGLVISGRQPRTAIGISQDKNTVILMEVDGRGTSIGATHEEMASLMKEYGAYEAMHLDGGGSSTMVVKEKDETSASVVNKVSDGSERKVMNALAVKNNAPQGNLASIEVKPSVERAFAGQPITFTVNGYDEYYHSIAVDMNQVTFTASAADGTFQGNQLTTSSGGNITVQASYQGLTGTADVRIMDPVVLTPSVSSILLAPGKSVSLSFQATGTEGYSAPITSGVSYELSDPILGTMDGGTFLAGESGSGYIKCTFQNAVCYIPVSIGGTEKVIDSFENTTALSFDSYPKTITGWAAVQSNFVSEGAKALEMNYTFAESTSTQAAYLNFAQPIQISNKVNSLSLSVLGNGSGDWVRGKIKDATGKEVVIDFTKDMGWTGWQTVTAEMPDGLTYPVQLTTLYVASLSNTNTAEQKICFDQLTGYFVSEYTGELPQSSVFKDKNEVEFSGKEAGSYYINMVGTVSSGTVDNNELYESQRKKVAAMAAQDADTVIFGGKSDISSGSADEIRWTSTYGFYQKDGVDILQLTAVNGGLKNTYSAQWPTFKKDVLASGNKNLIIMMDRTASAFTDSAERDLFTKVLGEIKDSGKEVFLVSSSGNSSWNTVKEGIHYINLPDLWVNNAANSNFKMLRIKLTGDQLTFYLQSVQ